MLQQQDMHCWCIAAAVKLTSVFFQTPPLIIILILAVFVLYAAAQGTRRRLRAMVPPSLETAVKTPALPRLLAANEEP
jgi:hypothetical protein